MTKALVAPRRIGRGQQLADLDGAFDRADDLGLVLRDVADHDGDIPGPTVRSAALPLFSI